MNTARKFRDDTTLAPPPLDAAILFVQRAAIRPILRQELKAAGVEELLSAEDAEGCAALLARYPTALLVIDWDHGSRVVNTLLRAAQGAFKADTRPIFLIAVEVSLAIVATGTEYNVTRVHAGEISRSAIQGHIDEIVRSETDMRGVRTGLLRVADARLKGDLAGAGDILEDLRHRFPDDARIACELADNMIQEERWAEAAALLESAHGIDRQNLRAQHLLSRCLLKSGRYEEAAGILSATRLINPHNVDRLIDLGDALMNLGRIQEALASFGEVLALDAGNKAAMDGKLQCQLMAGEVNEALALMRELSGPRELASLFNNAAVLSIRHGKFDQGTSLYKTAIAALGRSDKLVSRLLFNLGIAYHKMGRETEALGCFERATGVDPQFAKAKHNAVVTAARLGNFGAFEDETLRGR